MSITRPARKPASPYYRTSTNVELERPAKRRTRLVWDTKELLALFAVCGWTVALVATLFALVPC